MQYCDVITNPRWRTATNMTVVVGYISVKNGPIVMTFGTLNEMVTVI